MPDLTRRALLRTAAATGAAAGAGLLPAAPAAASTDPADLSVLQALAQLRAGALSPVELLEACLARIDRLDGEVQAFLLRTDDLARTAARASEARYAAGSPGLLDGVPVGVKDIYATAGVRTTAASGALSDWVPDIDATLVARLHGAGALMVGKTNTHEFAFGASTPPTRNPWDTSRHPGGSSGGSAAAVAARMVPMGTGSDTLGSLRIPPSVCGIVGHRPTFGLTSRHGVVPLSWSFDTTGLMARTVADASFLAEFCHRSDPYDATTAAAGTASYPTAPAADLRGVRLGRPTSWFFDGAEPGVRAAVETALREAERLGAEVVDVDLPAVFDAVMAPEPALDALVDDDAVATALAQGLSLPVLVAYTEAAAFHYRLRRERPTGYSADLVAVLELVERVPATAYLRANQLRSVFLAGMQDLFTTHGLDAVVCPTVLSAPTEQREHGGANGSGLLNGAEFAHNNTPWAFCGFPSLSMPVGLDEAGLPVGLMLSGAPRSDPRLFGIALVLEGALDFGRHVPTVLR